MPNPRLGYILVALSAACSALNGSLARYLLDDGMSPTRLSELRSAVSALLLIGALAAFSPRRLRIARADILPLAWLGIAGIALVHASYYLAISRMDIGVALVIQYLAPAMLLVWALVVHRIHAPKALWAAVALSIVGCALVVDAPAGTDNLDTIGVLAALAGAVTLAIYLTSSQRAGQRYDAFTTLAYGFGFATVFWLIVNPVWTFPWHLLGSTRNLLLALGVAVIGTLVPFLLMVTALRHLPAAKVAVVATLEPVLASIMAWFWLDQALSAHADPRRRRGARGRHLGTVHSMDVLVAGGHGQIARRLLRILASHGHHARGLIRNPDHVADLEADGALPVLCDLEHDDLRPHVGGADAIVFAAGAGPGSGPERKQTVDLGAAVKCIQAAQELGVDRFVIVSSIGVQDLENAGPMRVYLEAKAAADDAVRASGLSWTIVKPGSLSNTPGSGTVDISTALGRRGPVSRDNVASVLYQCLLTDNTIHKEFEVFDGDVPVEVAVQTL